MPSKCCPSQAFKYSRVLWKVSEERLEEALRGPQPDGGIAEVPSSSQNKYFQRFNRMHWSLWQPLSSALFLQKRWAYVKEAVFY